MDPITAIAAANGIIQLLNVLIPQIQAMAKSGQITVEEQSKVKANFDLLKANIESGAAFDGPEWKVDAAPAQPLTPPQPPIPHN